MAKILTKIFYDGEEYEIKDYTTEISTLSSSTKNNEDAINALGEEIGALGDKLPTIEEKVAEMGEEIKNMGTVASIERLGEQIEALGNNVVDNSQKINTLSGDVETLKAIDHSIYLTEHQPIKTINNIEIVGEGNIEINPFDDTDILNNIASLSGTIDTLSEDIKTIKEDGDKYLTQDDLTPYLTKTSGDTLYQPKGNYATNNELNDLSSQLDTKQPKGDYLTKASGDTLYQPKGNYLTQHQSLDAYATTDYVDQAVQGIPSDATMTKLRSDVNSVSGDVATLKAIDHSIYLTEHQPLKTINGYSIKGSGNVKIEYTAGTNIGIVGNKISVTGITVPTKVSDLENDLLFLSDADMNNYATKAESDRKYLTKASGDTLYQPKGTYLTSIPNTYALKADFYSKTEIDSKIDAAKCDCDMSQYYKKTDIDTLIDELNRKIAELEGKVPTGDTPSDTGDTPIIDWTDTGYTEGYVVKARYWVDESVVNLYNPKYLTITKLIVDGNEVNPIVSSYTFNTLGYHTAEITIEDKPNDAYITDSQPSRLFSGITHLTDVVFNSDIYSLSYETCYNATALSSVTIGDNVTRIGMRSFAGCTPLSSITIPNSVTFIDEAAFASCTSLTSITIPDSVTTFKQQVFMGCSNLTSVTLSHSVTKLESEMFRNCTSIKKITIPQNYTELGSYCFYSCDSLEDLYFERQLPPTITERTFNNMPNTYTIHVPAASLNAYKSADVWSQYADKIVGDL